MSIKSKQALKQGSGIGGRGYTPLAGKILKLPPPEDLEKNIPPLGGAKRRRHFLPNFGN